MTAVGPRTSWLVILPGVMLASIGTGLFNPAMSGVALSSAPPQMTGLAAGVNDTARQAGIAVGIAGLGALIPIRAVHPHSVAYVHGLREALLVCAVVAGSGAVAAWRLIGTRTSASANAAETTAAQTPDDERAASQPSAVSR